MISGNKKNIKEILPYVKENLQQALLYILETDFSKLADGEYEIDGRNIFARVNTYITEDKAVRRPEKHNQYIDVQFVAEGEEVIGYSILNAADKVVEDRSSKDDVLFYANQESENSVILKKGDFAVFFPWELHRPNCIAGTTAVQVRKVVVKVKKL